MSTKQTKAKSHKKSGQSPSKEGHRNPQHDSGEQSTRSGETWNEAGNWTVPLNFFRTLLTFGLPTVISGVGTLPIIGRVASHQGCEWK